MLIKQYGDQVDVRYIDIQNPAIHDYPKIQEMAQNNEMYLPIVLMDDEVIGTGYVSYPKIIKELTDRNIKKVG